MDVTCLNCGKVLEVESRNLTVKFLTDAAGMRPAEVQSISITCGGCSKEFELNCDEGRDAMDALTEKFDLLSGRLLLL